MKTKEEIRCLACAELIGEGAPYIGIEDNETGGSTDISVLGFWEER